MSIRSTILNPLLDLVWPRSCLICDTRIDEIETSDTTCVCRKCQNKIASNPQTYCSKCASTVGPHSSSENGCSRCRGQKFHFESALRLGVYEGVMRDAILRIKKTGGENLAESLGIIIGRVRSGEILAYNPQVIVPTPLHWSRWWTRGFNQAERIAHGLSEVIRRPVITRAIRRVKHTGLQTQRTPAERKANVDDAFCVIRPRLLKDMRVLLVDDVLTTGSTVEALSREILAAGATRVDVAVIAHR